MKNYSKKQFLQEVTDEIENIKLYATDKEKQNLDFDTFNPDNPSYCVYGQLTGDCESKRAIKLIRKCCKRYFHFLIYGIDVDDEFTFKDIKESVNGEKMPDKFDKSDFGIRNYEYHSLLEGFIKLKNANNKNIISYIKGKTSKLVLEKK